QSLNPPQIVPHNEIRKVFLSVNYDKRVLEYMTGMQTILETKSATFNEYQNITILDEDLNVDPVRNFPSFESERDTNTIDIPRNCAPSELCNVWHNSENIEHLSICLMSEKDEVG
ncbi:hypothetical protein CU098_007310, partial [Rhizopus stolonifer]